MNYKIIETSPELPDVLLYRDIDDEGNDIVVIHCSGYSGNNSEEDISFETVDFANLKSAQNFIRDYSQISATQWVKSQELTYSPEWNEK